MLRPQKEIKQKPVFNYSRDHLEKFSCIIDEEGKVFLKMPHPVQSKLIALKLLRFDQQFEIGTVVPHLYDLVADVMLQMAVTTAEENRLQMVERGNSLLGLIRFFNDIQQHGLGLYNKISN